MDLGTGIAEHWHGVDSIAQWLLRIGDMGGWGEGEFVAGAEGIEVH